MAEIKSTLDLVMERTSHLTLSDDEKREQREEDFRKLLQGLVQRFQDGTLKREEFVRELTALRTEHRVDEDARVLREILDRIDLDRDNARLLELLREVFGVETGPLAELVDAYEREIRRAVQDRMKEMKAEIEKSRKISGSAVVPNPRSDDQWKVEVDRIRREFEKRLEERAAAIA